MDPFTELALVVVFAAIFGFVAHYFKQPTLVGYLFAGIFLAGLVKAGYVSGDLHEHMIIFSRLGIAFLLFLVGLELNWSSLKEVGKPALWTAIGQIVFTFAIGLIILKIIGMALVPAIYVSIALTLSSTIIIVQLLSQKKDLASLYGKIVVGFLLVQDFVALLALIFLSGLSQVTENSPLAYIVGVFSLSLIKGGILVVASLYLSKFIFPRVLDFLGKSQELLFIFGNAWGLGLAALMASPFVGFSYELGGFIAGLTLASSVEHAQLASRIRPMRDFFIMLFFVLLGSQLVFENLSAIILKTILLSVFVLIGNPLIVMLIMSFLGYRLRTSFLASLTVAQISEFSLIIADMGLKLGHIKNSDASLVTLVGVITITISSYLILHGDALYAYLKPWLKWMEYKKGIIEKVQFAEVPYANHIVLLGVHRMGENILAAIKSIEESYVLVDFDPAVVEKYKKLKEPIIYGDISEDEIKEIAVIHRARVIISTIPDLNDNTHLLNYLKKVNPKAITILTAENEWEAKDLYMLGAAYVILPHFIGGLQIAQSIKREDGFDHLDKLKKHDLALMGNGL